MCATLTFGLRSRKFWATDLLHGVSIAMTVWFFLSSECLALVAMKLTAMWDMMICIFQVQTFGWTFYLKIQDTMKTNWKVAWYADAALRTLFWFIITCSITSFYRYFGGNSCLHVQCDWMWSNYPENRGKNFVRNFRTIQKIVISWTSCLSLLLLKCPWLTLCKSENMTPSPSALGIRTCHLWMTFHVSANETSVTLITFSQVSRRFMLTCRRSNMETLLASPHVPQGYIYMYKPRVVMLICCAIKFYVA